MIKRMLFFCIALALTAGIGAPSARADDPNRLSQLQISVWPEYDTSTVLVMLDGTFADASSTPRQVSVLIPSGAKLHVATYANADGTLAKELPAKSTDLGDGYTRVTYEVPAANFWLEYYHDALRGSPDKMLDFAIKAPAPAELVTLEVQQPLKASNFAISPSMPNQRTESGFTYFNTTFSNVATDQAITALVKYTKSDPSPSVVPAAAPLTAPAPVPAATSAPSPWSNAFVIAGMVILGLTAVLGLFTLRQRSQRLAMATIGNRAARRGKNAPRGTVPGNQFCTQCGRALGRDDSYCPKCGAKRKVV